MAASNPEVDSPLVESRGDEEEKNEVSQDKDSEENVVLTSVTATTCSMPGLEPIAIDQTEMIPKETVPSIDEHGISYIPYESEVQLPDIMELMKADLSEPYSIYTFRYFIHQWPQLCILARYNKDCVGAIVCKLDIHRPGVRRGYIAMLAVHRDHRRKHIGSNLVKRAIGQMITDGCDEVVLEAEVSNSAALSLYANLGFVRDKYLHRYYLNGADAYRLKLWLTEASLD